MYNGQTYTVKDPDFIAKYAEYKELNKLELATSAAATAGGFIFHVPLLSESVSFVKGVVKNPEDNRFKSGAKQVYKDSIFSYVEEGKDIDIKENTMFILKFKSSDIEDLDTEEEQENLPESANDDNNTDVSNEQQKQTSIPKEAPQEIQIQASKVPVISDETTKEVKHIEALDPDEVLKEVELNTK